MPRRLEEGSWDVVKVGGIAAANLDISAEIRADEKPPTPDDPRNAADKNASRVISP
jgi:hypothetical protein